MKLSYACFVYSLLSLSSIGTVFGLEKDELGKSIKTPSSISASLRRQEIAHDDESHMKTLDIDIHRSLQTCNRCTVQGLTGADLSSYSNGYNYYIDNFNTGGSYFRQDWTYVGYFSSVGSYNAAYYAGGHDCGSHGARSGAVYIIETTNPSEHLTATVTEPNTCRYEMRVKCYCNPTPSPTKGPTKAPTKAPTTAPTEIPSQTPSNEPSLAPSEIPSQTPSDQPSLAPSFPTWEIANATFADYLNQQTSFLTLEHVIGTANSDLELTLYDYDCETVVTSDNAVSLTNKLISDGKASYDVVLARESVGSSVFLEGGDELQFCVGAALHVPNDTNGWGSIVSKKTKIAIAFDLANAQFTVTTFETQAENPVDTNIEADDNFYEMEACICSNSFTCDSLNGVVAAQQENSVVIICLKPPTGLNFEGYNMIFSKGDVEPDQSDFLYDAIGAPFTSEEKEGNMIRVRTQLLSGLFDVGEDGLARVSGTGTFVFDTNAKDGKGDEVEGSYKMFVGLQEVEECGDSFFDRLHKLLFFGDARRN